MNEAGDIKKDWNTVLWVSIVVFVLMVISGFALTAGHGLEDNTFVLRFTIYSILGGAGLAFLLVGNFLNFFNHKRIIKTIVHDPEDGLLGGLRVVRNPLLLMLGMFIVFLLPLFWLGKFSNTFFSGIPFKAQQITTFSNIWADSVFPALAENMFIFIPLCLIYTWNWKANKGRGTVFWAINLIVIPLVFAFAWQFFHLAVYGSNEVALVSTFIFGFVGVLLTMTTMSFIPWAAIHFLTNFMLAVKQYGLMSEDLVTVVLVAFEVLLVIAFIFVWRLGKDRRKA